MFASELEQLGLSKEESAVYEALLAAKSLTAAELLSKIPYKKGNLYNILHGLEEKGLVLRSDKAKRARFEAAHPNKVLDLVEKRDQELHKAKTSIEAALPQILSAYNLNHAKPGVRFYEGLEGMKKVAYDSLTAKTEILQFVDIEALKGFQVMEADYVRKREKLGIKKRFISPDTASAREDAKSYNWNITDARIIEKKFGFAQTLVQIYDNKTTYITLGKNKLIGVIIEDDSIATLNRTLFEFMWDKAKPVRQTTASSN